MRDTIPVAHGLDEYLGHLQYVRRFCLLHQRDTRTINLALAHHGVWPSWRRVAKKARCYCLTLSSGSHQAACRGRSRLSANHEGYAPERVRCHRKPAGWHERPTRCHGGRRNVCEPRHSFGFLGAAEWLEELAEGVWALPEAGMALAVLSSG